MFTPVSKLNYFLFRDDGHIVVVTFSRISLMHAAKKWRDRAAAVFRLKTTEEISFLIEDLLANPHIRALCFEEDGPLRAAIGAVWKDERPPGCRVSDEHLTLVRQFVDLYDGDCRFRVAPFPYWPEPIRYDK